jgi:hypothetical protein
MRTRRMINENPGFASDAHLLDTPAEAAYVRGIDFGSAFETCRVRVCASREGEGNTARGDR